MRFRAHIVVALATAFALPLALVVPAPSATATTATSATSTAASADVAPFPAGITRLSGASRYETAVAVSKRYAPGVPVAFVATGTAFPDALSAAAAAALRGGPLLLTPATQLPAAVSNELTRLRPARIYVVGGSAVVSSGVQTALNRIAPTSRLYGADRYATGRAIITRTFSGGADHAVIATGRTFPDALAATGAAGARQAPVILVDGARSTVPAATLKQLGDLGVSSISIAGGPGAVSNGIQSQLTSNGYSVTRYGGASRYETAALINQAYFPAGAAASTFVATGVDFPDALAAAALAGHLGAPLNVTPRTCMHPAVSDAIRQVDAPSRVVLGGTAVVSDRAAADARCVYPITSEPLADWALTGWQLASDIPAPYFDIPAVNVDDPSIKLDSTGLRIYLRRDTGTRGDHPVAYAQYGIAALARYQETGDPKWLTRAIRHADRLTQIRVERAGAWWYPYNWPWTYYTRTMKAPWYSAMAQGQALSLFTRLAEETGQAKWVTAADKTWATFKQPYSARSPWSSLVIDRHLYFEEYAGNQPPLLVLNGQIFALFGLYDYWRYTGNAEVARYFDGGATAVVDRMMPLVRVPGGTSYYCVQAEYCQSPLWQNAAYHGIHSWQLDTLARITGDTRFTTWAADLRADRPARTFGSTSDFEPGVPDQFAGVAP
ncbi:cell wall-binding repeat-containing protein [Agromyces sp. SYSU K20354]|uniref:cell wall-binding repeat-containing protein n=1 Tax=Agromyces cavernae TaxID=2898659 RepID=UPI001E63C27B|nr:cell wall-binding repeat-containing protein [Agromyces cavernae]MCD2444059.1 cell wall-binding repeat-containing protein [Agromyces cavernae]